MKLCLSHDQAEKLMRDTLTAMNYCRARKIGEAEEMMRVFHSKVSREKMLCGEYGIPWIMVEVHESDVERYKQLVTQYHLGQVDRMKNDCPFFYGASR